VTDSAPVICGAMQRTAKPIIVIDDFQYILANEFMRRVLDNETGNQAFAKYNEIARHAWDILMMAGKLPDSTRVYILAHTQTDELGQVRMKTVGKLVDQHIVPEGFFTIVLRTDVINGNYRFATQTNGQDCCKSPIGMFNDMHIPNDLAEVDKAICEFYGLTDTA